jgi:ferredoxin-NADP reductase
MPLRDHLRITIAVAGDTTARLARIRTGTRVVIEGPYGVFTDRARTRRGAALIGAGVGITPLRALLEEMPPDVDVVVVQRASREQEMVHRDELEQLLRNRGGRMVALPGSRWAHRLDDWRRLQALVPDLALRDVFVCGPQGFTEGVVRAARCLGVPAGSIHREAFEF